MNGSALRTVLAALGKGGRPVTITHPGPSATGYRSNWYRTNGQVAATITAIERTDYTWALILKVNRVGRPATPGRVTSDVSHLAVAHELDGLIHDAETEAGRP